MLENTESMMDMLTQEEEGDGAVGGVIDPLSPEYCSHMATHQHCWSQENNVCLGCGATRGPDGEITRPH